MSLHLLPRSSVAVMKKNSPLAKQTGIVLFMSLILLFSITLIAAATFYNSISESKIAANLLNLSQQSNADDIARTFAQNWLNTVKFIPPPCSTPAECQACAQCVWKQGVIRPSTQPESWWNTHGITINPSNGVACINQPPQFVVEEYNCDILSQTRTYRITTRTPRANPADPPLIREYLESPVLQQQEVILFNRSCLATGTVALGTVWNNFRPSTNAKISRVWIGNGCWNYSGTFTIRLNNNRTGEITIGPLNLPPANTGCGGSAGGTWGTPKSNMSRCDTPLYDVRTTDTVRITITSSCAYHYFNPNFDPANNQSYPIRLTIEGIPEDICTPPINAGNAPPC